MTPPPVLEAAGPAASARQASLARYALWQARDYALQRGLPTVAIAGLVGVLAALPIRAMYAPDYAVPGYVVRQQGSVDAARHLLVAQASAAFLRQTIGSLVFLGALLAMNGLVSNDRRMGYYRFLFTKPLSPARYYGQAFVVHGVGFLLTVALLGAAWAAFVAPLPGAALFAAVVSVYLCYAGIAFLLTASVRWDWLSLVVVALASTFAWGRWGQSDAPVARLVYLLPPLTRVDEIYDALAHRAPLPLALLAWLGGYGLACWLAGLVVLHWRRLATT